MNRIYMISIMLLSHMISTSTSYHKNLKCQPKCPKRPAPPGTRCRCAGLLATSSMPLALVLGGCAPTRRPLRRRAGLGRHFRAATRGSKYLVSDIPQGPVRPGAGQSGAAARTGCYEHYASLQKLCVGSCKICVNYGDFIFFQTFWK